MSTAVAEEGPPSQTTENAEVGKAPKKMKPFRISNEMREHGYMSLENVMKEYSLDTESPKVTIIGNKPDGSIGTDSAKDSSI